MVDSGYVLVPQSVKVSFDVFPVMNILNTMHELSTVENYTGLGKWVYDAAARMSPERKRMNMVLFWAMKPLTNVVVPPKRTQASFEEYLDELRGVNPQKLHDEIFSYWVNKATHVKNEKGEPISGLPSIDAIEHDVTALMTIMDICFDEGITEEDRHVFQQAHNMLKDPRRALDAIIDHLQYVWNDLELKEEWRRNLPMLEESAAAYSKRDFSGMSVLESLKAITGRDLSEVWGSDLRHIEGVTFIPSPTIGPYVSYRMDTDTSVIMFYGARVPKEAQSGGPEISRPELLIRLNALADDNRLKILEMLTRVEEMCAQDIIEELGLSQSSVSRHLSQLSATGYVIERRKEVSKCYSLNTDRLAETLKALGSFLSKA